jgi:PAS domain S-box-containing protein
LEHRLRVGDEERWVHCRADITFDANGKPVSVLGTTQDVSERYLADQLLQEQHDRYAAIFAQSSDGIVLVDADTTQFVEFNDAAYLNLGYTREEFSRMTVPDIEAKESAAEVSAHRQRMIQRGGDVFETRHRCKSGEIRDVRVSSQFLVLHGKRFISAIFSDITESRQSVAKLQLLSTCLLMAARRSPSPTKTTTSSM